MALRNFWIEAEVEGRKVPLTFGGKAMTLTVKVNDGGESVDALHIECRVHDDGTLSALARANGDFWLPGDGEAFVEANKKRARRHSAAQGEG